MSASPDDILQRILSQGDANAPGLLGMVNRGTAPFGGAGNLGLQLLANSGYSRTPQTLGSTFAQSALNAQQVAAGAQEQQMKQQLLMAQLKALQAKPTVNPMVVDKKLIDPSTGRVIYGGGADINAIDPAKYTPGSLAAFQGGGGTDYSLLKPYEKPEAPMDELAKLTADFKAGRITPEDYKARRDLMTTRAPPSAAAQGFEDPKVQALQASMALAGVSMPAGLRSQAQQLSVYKGLLARNPDSSPDEIVAGIRTGQLDFNGAKRSTAQLATAAAVTDAASRQIEKNFASIEPLVSKVDATGRPVIDQAIAQLKRNWKSGGDKDTSAFVAYLKAIAGEYAKIQSGGIGSAAPAEPELQAAMKIMTDAYSEGGYQGLKEAITTEAKNKQASYQEGLQGAAKRSTAGPAVASQSITKVIGGVIYVNPSGRPDDWHKQ